MMLNDVKTIVDHLEDFIELPNGIERLRKTVLTLAVSGKLVIQDPAEGTGEELYGEILKTRQSEESAVNKKKAPDLKEISIENAPFKIPKTWKWLRVQSVAHDCGQKTPDKDFYYVDVSSIDAQKGIIKEPKMMTASSASSRARKLVENGSVIYSGIRPYLLNTAVVDLSQFNNEVIVSTAFFVLQPWANISSEYIHLVVRSPFFDDLANKESVGAAYPAINADKFLKLPVPLPPIAEQKRIVAKVEEVMQQLDALETTKQERDEIRKRLTRSAMYSLGLGDTKIALQNLQELIKNPNDVRELEKCILSLAVSGKLAPQDDSDVHIKEQLELSDQARIATAKNDHRADTESLALLSANERWSIPPSWEWRALADLVLFVDYRGKTPTKTERGIRLITAKNIKKGFISLSPEEFLSEVDYHSWMTRGIPEIGDVLFTTEAPMGNAAVVDLSDRFALAQRVICLHSYGAISPGFLVLQLLADPFQSILIKEGTGMTAKGIKASKLKRLPIAVPPLAEQDRIVKKVELMMESIRSLRSILSC